MKRLSLHSVSLAILLLTGQAFGMEQSNSADGISYFETHIRPLLIQHCYECHSAKSGNSNGGLRLDTQSGWEQGGDRGAAVVPGDIGASLLVRAVRYDDPEVKMPPGGQLPDSLIAHLEHWVSLGAPDPRDDASAPAASGSSDPSDPVAGRNHWAFRPLDQSEIPVVSDNTWARRELDRFVIARLETAGLDPSADADPRILVRRLYIQLIGIAPSPEQVKSFLDDGRPDAPEYLVDELMSSRHFAERWGRHWLDLARYADSNGLDENFLFREAWRYRNWVIDAIDQDMAFDRFVLEQIAGDLLAYDSIDQRDHQRTASGFLAMGPKVLLGVAPERQKMEIADEQIDTIGRAVLGQTLGCARCHDHKFDPIPTRDYYALAGIFTSTQVMEKRYMLNQQRVMERLVGLGAGGVDRDNSYEKYWRERPRVGARHAAAKAALELLKNNNEAGLQQAIQKDASTVAEGARSAGLPMEQRQKAQQALVDEIGQVFSALAGIPPRAMAATDVESPTDEHVRMAGAFDSPDEDELVPRGFLQVATEDAEAIPSGQSGRLQLAHWLTNEETGAGRLTARVLANRIWHHVMGQGIVRTVDNFGRTGDLPSHPELLDYLASRLIENGWSIKSIVREVVLSRTNMMGSQFDDHAYGVDPENRLLWRYNRRRLDPESLRDSLLAASGQLDRTPLDSTVDYLTDQATGVGNGVRRRTDYFNRSVYLPVVRNDLPELFDVFDFADPQRTTGRRPDTTAATQALFALNDPMVMDASGATAKRVIAASQDSAGRVRAMFDLICGATPTETEHQSVMQFLSAVLPRLQTSDPQNAELKAWGMVCHSMFASSRFQILE